MTEPFIFIGTHAAKEGKRADFEKGLRQIAEVVEANEPRILAFNIYLNEEGDRASVVQIHPDADSMLFHMQVVHEHIRNAAELLDTERIDIYGPPTEAVLEMIRQLTAAGVPLTLKPRHLAGFTRLSS